MSAIVDCMKVFPIYILRGAFCVARFYEQGNARAFRPWNGRQDWLHVFYVHRCRTAITTPAAFREPGRTLLQVSLQKQKEVASGITRYHALYYATLLTQQQANGDLSSLSQSLLSSTVDINPHQIDAALFAFASPFSKGVVLADEVGLGKTIEAGLVVCQYCILSR